MYLPASVRAVIGNRTGQRDEVGCSASTVVVYDDMVLKIEPPSPESDRAAAMMRWLDGRLPGGAFPALLAEHTEDGLRYLVMSRVHGVMACDAAWLDRPAALLERLGAAMRLLWSVDVEDCPAVCDLDAELRELRGKLARGEIDRSPDRLPEGFSSPKALLDELERNRPDEVLVLTHGDFCLPNILLDETGQIGFIDLGGCGLGDCWRDISLCWQSLCRNCSGFFGGPVRTAPDRDAFFAALGIPCDEARLDYYLLLDRFYALT